jgi:long-chain acyl-CoA synthetase
MSDVSRIFDLLQLYRNEFSAKDCVFGFKKLGEWHHVSAQSYVTMSDRISLALLASGFSPGDRIATIMGNMPEWNYLDMGILQAGCVHVPVYPSLSADNYRFIFNDAGVKMIIVGCRDAWDRIRQPVEAMQFDGLILSLEKIEGVTNLTDFIRPGIEPDPEDQLEILKAGINPQSLATIIYTSGTTGYPKGVMLSHTNLVSNFTTVSLILKNYEVRKALSFLPLCHVYERMLNYMYQYLGISVYYAEHIDRIRDNLKEVKPDMFCAVPRVIEKSYAAILRKGKNLKAPRKLVFFWALRLGFKFEIEKLSNPVYRLKLKIADMLVFRKWRAAFGNHIKFIVSGGAPLNSKLARIFWASGIKIIEGYGLTETSPVIATGNFEPGGFRFGTVGPVIPGVEVSFTPEGEIICRGPNIMMGYYNRPDITAGVMDADGWFHTGDVGEMEDGKFLKITDRKKEIFKTSGGKYIAPQVVENKLKESPFIENLLVIGENRNYPSALIVPNFDYLRSWCKDKGIPYSGDHEMVRSEVVKNRIHREISCLNQSLDHTSQIRKFTLVDKEWTVQSGELSFTMKVRRTHLQEQFAHLIAGMYQESPEIHSKHREKKKKRKKGR